MEIHWEFKRGSQAISAELGMRRRTPCYKRELTMMDIKFRYKSIRTSMRNGTCLLLAGLLSVGSPLMAGEPVPIGATEEIRSSDVVLHNGGVLQGTVLNTEGQPVSGVTVNILHKEASVATTVSNEEGKFAVRGLRNGAHIIEVGTKHQAVRLWGTNTAPPAAIENVAVVLDEEAVRGQMFRRGGGGMRGGLPGSRIGGLALIGAATAITLGTTLDNNATPASP